MDDETLLLADILREFIKRSGYTIGQLARLSGIPKPTIVNWADGRVRRPRNIHDLISLAISLHITETDTNRLLQAAGHPTLAEWRQTVQQTGDSTGAALLENWSVPAPPRPPAPAPFQALPNLPYFVGRKTLLAEITAALLAPQQTGVTTLYGMPGVGKTALALQLAYNLRDKFADGVLWARVDTTEPLTILNTFATAYGLDIHHVADLHSRSRLVRELLAPKKALIILDNAQNSAQIKPLLPPSGSCAVLITTRRHNLSVSRGGSRFAIRPFNPQRTESIQLFARVLGKTRVAEEQEQFAALAALLGHLPLAVDIAAARLAYEPGWSTAGFLQRMQREQERLAELDFDDQSVRLSFNTSFRDLSATDQQVFAVCGLFSGDDFTATAVAHIANIPLEAAQDALRRLFLLSLLSAGRQSGQNRYRAHPLLRDYSRQQPLPANAWDRFIDYFFTLVKQESLNFFRLALDEQHIFTALHKAAELGKWSLFVDGCTRFYPFLEAQGRYDDAAAFLEMAGTAINHLPLAAQLQLHYAAGRLAQRRGEYIEAETRYEETLALARDLAEQPTISQLLRGLGVLAARRGDYVLAGEYYKEGLTLAPSVGESGIISKFLRGLGIEAYMRGDFTRAEAFFETGLSLMGLTDEQSQDPRGQSGMNWGLAVLAQEQGDTTRAALYFDRALSAANAAGNRERIIMLQRQKAVLLQEQNAGPAAYTLLQESLQLAREMGHSWQIGRLLAELGDLQLQMGEIPAARAAFTELYELARILRSKILVAEAQFGLAQALAAAGDAAAAEQYGYQALDSFTEMGHQNVQRVQEWLRELPAA